MNTVLKWRAAPAAVLLSMLCSACSGDDSGADAFAADDGLLRYVPADTPYVFATGEAVDDELLDALEPHIEELLAAYRDLMRGAVKAGLAEHREENPEMDPAARAELERTAEAVESFLALLSVDGLHDAGITRDSRMVFFGNGLLPVLRIELSDPELFEKAIISIEESAGEALPVAMLGNLSYRYIGNDEVRIIVGTFDGDAVLTFMPTSFGDEQAQSLLGVDLPGSNIASTNALGAIVEKYGYTNHFIGFVDTVRLVSTFLDAPSGLNAALFAGADFDSTSMSPVCKTEIRELAGIAPRMVFGYDQLDLEALSGSAVIELRSDLAQALTAVSSVVPGLGIDQGGVMSLGASVNFKAWREFYAARLTAMEADPFECEYFAELQASTVKGRELLAQPLPPVVYGIRGFNAVLESLEGIDLASGSPPEKIDASLVLAMDDAAALVAMGALFSPELAALNLQPDGKPVPLELAQLAAVSEEAFVAMNEEALAITVGSGAENRVASVLAAPSASPAPVFAMTMDAGEYYGLIAQGMAVAPDEGGDELPPEAQEALQRMMLKFADIYDRMSVEVRFVETGAEIRNRVTLKDL